MLTVNSDAPVWAFDMAREVEREMAASLSQPFRLPAYTGANLPAVLRWNNCAIIVSDEAGGRTIATSDGTNWRRVSDGAVVS